MRAFIDYQNKIPHRIFIPEENKVYRVSDKELINFLKKMNIKEVYIESAPKEWIRNLLNNNTKVYVLRVKNHREWRKKYNLRKNHENDAKMLYLIYQENPRIFREYCKRQLDSDPDVQRYVLLLREIKRVRQKIKVNEKLGLPIEHLKQYEKDLARNQIKLLNHLSKKYSELLNKFRDVKGLAGGNLLYFLSLIPHVQSFKSPRNYLVYLGLRATPPRRTWNREARDVLIRISMKVAKYEDVKFNPRKPNWRHVRKIALIIYNKLRGENEVR